MEDMCDIIARVERLKRYPHGVVPVLTVRRILDWENPLERYDECDFKEIYRLSKSSVHELYRLLDVRRSIDNRGCPFPPLQQLLLALRYFETGSFQVVYGDLVKVSQPTVSRCVAVMAIAIAGLREQLVRLPKRTEIASMKAKFHSIAGFPGVSGCIGCTHVTIASPGGEMAQVFRNWKGTFSINLQVVYGPSVEFLDIVASWPGSTHDSIILENSRFGNLLRTKQYPGIILGDAGYARKPYLLTPLQSPETASEKRHNKAHVKTRNSVERAFGVWKKRLPCLRSKLCTKLDTRTAIIVAVAVLYNFALQSKDTHGDTIMTAADEQDITDQLEQNDRCCSAFRRAFI
ncbi:putative nuclease HARBI1 [Ornithodoros turicata]|uniref:putative nuclease HARBI1 n=1 Tax=Ornithodoros turicata TaxID=34597 RepID=UPI00313A230C